MRASAASASWLNSRSVIYNPPLYNFMGATMQSRLCIIVVLALLSQGCGRKGPLYLPHAPQPTPGAPAASAVPNTQTDK
ncbi:MAG: hypothetical protein GJU76_06620 [Gallionella sp.]|jgi:predicted small lipoprotein YifL|nr:hypothetical protein [Gallionella sp.]